MARIVSYNKLWKLLIDKGMKKTDLIEVCGISTASLAKLGKGDNMELVTDNPKQGNENK